MSDGTNKGIDIPAGQWEIMGSTETQWIVKNLESGEIYTTEKQKPSVPTAKFSRQVVRAMNRFNKRLRNRR